MASIKAHVDYISRNGKVELTDQEGRTYIGKAEATQAFYDFAYAGTPLPIESRQREAYNMILSMPPGTDKAGLKRAVTAFAAEAFGDKRQYLMAMHDDTDHPHVHLAVKSRDGDGTRLDLRKAELQQMRELFADKLMAEGIEANATPRRARGVIYKPEKTPVYQRARAAQNGKGNVPRTLDRRIAEAARHEPVNGPWDQALRRNRDALRQTLAEFAAEHAGTPLARQAQELVRTLPTKTRRQRYRDIVDRQQAFRMQPERSAPTMPVRDKGRER